MSERIDLFGSLGDVGEGRFSRCGGSHGDRHGHDHDRRGLVAVAPTHRGLHRNAGGC
jgi:hypothetical protein